MQSLRLISRIETDLVGKFRITTLTKLIASRAPSTKQLLFTTSQSQNKLFRQNYIQQQHRYLTKPSKNEQKLDENDSQNVLFTIPNYLTTGRILSIPFINYFVFINEHEYACALFFLAGLTDFLDGYVARNWPNQKSYLGSILDPLADKLLIGSLTITLAMTGMMPIQLALIILARDISLILFSLYVRFRTLEAPVTLHKFVNVKKYASVQVEADYISKVNTLLQLALITFTLPSCVFGYVDSELLCYLRYVTGFTTILSAMSYLYKGGSYKLVKK